MAPTSNHDGPPTRILATCLQPWPCCNWLYSLGQWRHRVAAHVHSQRTNSTQPAGQPHTMASSRTSFAGYRSQQVAICAHTPGWHQGHSLSCIIDHRTLTCDMHETQNKPTCVFVVALRFACSGYGAKHDPHANIIPPQSCAAKGMA